MQEIAEPVFGECKVHLTGSLASTLDVDAETKDFFSYKNPFSGDNVLLLSYRICVPYCEDYRERADTFAQTLLED